MPLICPVLVPLPFDKTFDYLIPEGTEAAPGDFVRVPFGSQEIYGVVWGEPEVRSQNPESRSKLKSIASRVDYLPPLSPVLREFIDWTAWYSLAPKGMVLKMAMSVPEALHAPSERARRPALPESRTPHPAPRTLNPAQQQAAETLITSLDQGFSVTVLDGVTGSGKTEVYFEAISRQSPVVSHPKNNPEDWRLETGDSQTLVLLPEIALSVQWLKRFEQRFGEMPHLWHSGVTPARRRETWRAVARGEARVVVGARSALFLPFRNLKLIVVDEEHEPSYKQEEGVIYQARDLAVVRARKERCPVILASATPSLETVVNIEQGKYRHLHLPERHGGATLPEVELIDLRAHKPGAERWISDPLRTAVVQALEAGQQAMLFINRRGFAPLVLCKSCGHRFGCPHCDAWLVLHRTYPYTSTPSKCEARSGGGSEATGAKTPAKTRLQCHHCDYRTPVPEHCPDCGALAEESLHPCGPGVERLAEEAGTLFPEARIGLMTSDSLPTASAVEQLIEAVEAGGVNLLIGTQMMAKGHHFPDLAVVGIIDADMGLMGGDLRAGERCWQLLHQLAGRAGRASVRGRVLVQTTQPEHAVMQALLHHDRENFIEAEKQGRMASGMPPFGRLAALILEGKNDAETRDAARLLARSAPSYRGMQLFGPAPAPLSILRGKYRYRLLLKTAREVNLPRLLREWLEPVKLPRSVRLKVDVEPYSFM